MSGSRGLAVQPLLDLTGFTPGFGFGGGIISGFSGFATQNPLITNFGARVARSIDPQGYGFSPEVTIEEDAEDLLEITQHPVEQGAAITDHAYKRPAELRMRIGWSDRASNRTCNQIYGQILDLQSSRRPFTIITGKRSYSTMLIADIRQHTDAKFEFSLIVDITFRQILLVKTQTTTGATPSSDATSLADAQSNQTSTQGGTVNPVAASLTAEGVVGAGGYDPVTGNPSEGIPPQPAGPSGGSEVGAGGGTDPITGNPTLQRMTWYPSSRSRPQRGR